MVREIIVTISDDAEDFEVDSLIEAIEQSDATLFCSDVIGEIDED